MIETKGLHKVFHSSDIQTIALENINLNIEEGEFTSIMGPSGCGKSTLLHVLGMIDDPTKGDYFFMGKNVAKLSEKEKNLLRKKNIGFVFQNFNLIEDLTLWENIELPLIYQGIKKTERKRRVEEVIDRLEISHRKDLLPLQLSGGQQQRVAVARAIVGKPRLLLADEPTGNLDSMHGEELMNMLNELNKEGMTVVMVTHSQHDASYSHRIIHLFDGQIINENLNRHR
ncbi:MAG: ABC transporter ATP-binding protein [Bacteroidales bacterium]|nr:ABC transporter ATP-binding protein [Bacteroidales bacterium]